MSVGDEIRAERLERDMAFFREVMMKPAAPKVPRCDCGAQKRPGFVFACDDCFRELCAADKNALYSPSPLFRRAAFASLKEITDRRRAEREAAEQYADAVRDAVEHVLTNEGESAS